jgi:hypothetical protein
VEQQQTRDLEAGLDEIRSSPADAGTVELIVRRPDAGQREAVDRADLDVTLGLVGDSWHARGSSRTADGKADPRAQVTIMNARAAALVAGPKERWALAGDQLFVDFDLSEENVPPGTRLAIGDAIVEVTDKPHNGCAKFRKHFGADVVRFVNSPDGKQLHLRGINTRVVEPGEVRAGSPVRKA